jgi:hypothetical protein
LSDEKTTGWPAEADNVDRRSESDDAGFGDGSLWDFAAIAAPTPVPQFNDSEVLVSPIVAC